MGTGAKVRPSLLYFRYTVYNLHSPEDTHKQDVPQSILRIVSILRFQPKLLYGINAFLEPSQRVEYSTMVDEVKYFVFIGQGGARIFSTSPLQIPYPSSDQELREVVVSQSTWKTLLESDPDKDWLTCISQLLQVILDDPSTKRECARRAFRCLRELAEQSILPPSIFINDLNPEKGHAVQGGSFADIYKGKRKGAPVCFRVLRMFQTEDRKLLFKEFCSELLLWRQLRHPNILPLMGANLELFAPQFCFISPWLRNGDIMMYLKQHPGHDRFTSICEIVNGIEYLHGLDPPVTHKDIKGANVLVGDDLVCRLADFGLSSIVDSQRLGRASPSCAGSVCWMAPEIMDPSRIKVKNPKAGDIYALACTIYEIYTGKAPFLTTNEFPPTMTTIILAVLAGQRPALPPPGTWTNEEEHLWWLVGLCWKENPEERPEMHLIKRTLQDIGTFKPATTETSLTSLPPHNGTAARLAVIEQWVARECEQETQLSSDAMGVAETSRNILNHHGRRQSLSSRPKETLRHDERKRLLNEERVIGQPYPHSSSRRSGREKSLNLSFSLRNMEVSGYPQGLLTPNTPSIPLAHFDLQSARASSPDIGSDNPSSMIDGNFLNSPPPGRNNVGTEIGAAEITYLPSSLSIDQLRPFGVPSLPTPPSTPLPSHSRHPSSCLSSDISVKPSEAASVNAEARVPRSGPSDTPVCTPLSDSLRSNRPTFLPVHLRPSGIKYGSRPRVNKPSLHPSRALSFSPASSPLNQISQPILPRYSSVLDETPRDNPMSLHGDSQPSMLPVLRNRPFAAPFISSASSSKK
ncbi:hypothetical protein GALMADRAFT_257468 [Galerina marginata CBS 339.88]|uniref:Protein kinase domain-containing protein n=1 Tax=Galerina marginata (strain CBS 339.88) TaxID=685588 RepID=A0A067SAT6_GALM3|nr:hypothetical protein GALMADRAFT_257468 [Galerina marginata CBS 339.88]